MSCVWKLLQKLLCVIGRQSEPNSQVSTMDEYEMLVIYEFELPFLLAVGSTGIIFQ